MKLRIFLAITLVTVSLSSGLAKAQTSITNNSGTSGLYSVSGTSYYQSPVSAQQNTYNVNQAANGLILQNQITGVTIDPSSAPPYSAEQKSNNKYRVLGYLAILLVIVGGVILFMGVLKRQPIQLEAKEPEEIPKEPKPETPKTPATAIETESKTEEVEKEEKKPKNTKKKRKNKKHHR